MLHQISKFFIEPGIPELEQSQPQVATVRVRPNPMQDDNYICSDTENDNANTSGRVSNHCVAKPLNCPPPKQGSDTNKVTSTEADERELEQIYDQSTWNMFYLIASARSRSAAMGSRNSNSSNAVKVKQGIAKGSFMSITKASSTTPKLVACADHSDTEDDEYENESEDEPYKTMPFHLDDF